MALSTSPKTGLLIHGAAGDEHYAELMRQWRGLETLIQPVVDGFPTSPPGTPADGDTVIVGAVATGSFTGHEGKFARFSSVLAAWEFIAPLEGWITYDRTANALYRFDGAGWVQEVADGLPSGGTDGQVIKKVAGVAAWAEDLTGAGSGDLPPGGTDGQVLAKVAGSPAWADIEPGLPSGGTDGQVVKKVGGVAAWAEDAGGPPAVVTKAGGTTGVTSSDANTYMRFTYNVGPKSANFPSGLASGVEFHIRNADTGALTLEAGAGGVVLNPPAGGTLVLNPHMTVTVKHVGSDVFDVMGQTVPA